MPSENFRHAVAVSAYAQSHERRHQWWIAVKVLLMLFFSISFSISTVFVCAHCHYLWIWVVKTGSQGTEVHGSGHEKTVKLNSINHRGTILHTGDPKAHEHHLRELRLAIRLSSRMCPILTTPITLTTATDIHAPNTPMGGRPMAWVMCQCFTTKNRRSCPAPRWLLTPETQGRRSTVREPHRGSGFRTHSTIIAPVARLLHSDILLVSLCSYLRWCITS